MLARKEDVLLLTNKVDGHSGRVADKSGEIADLAKDRMMIVRHSRVE